MCLQYYNITYVILYINMLYIYVLCLEDVGGDMDKCKAG
jgi:hypothetical protein